MNHAITKMKENAGATKFIGDDNFVPGNNNNHGNGS